MCAPCHWLAYPGEIKIWTGGWLMGKTLGGNPGRTLENYNKQSREEAGPRV